MQLAILHTMLCKLGIELFNCVIKFLIHRRRHQGGEHGGIDPERSIVRM